MMNHRALFLIVGTLIMLTLPVLAMAQPPGPLPIPEPPAGNNPVAAPPAIELPISAPSVAGGVPASVPPIATTPLTLMPGTPPVDIPNGEDVDNGNNSNPVVMNFNGPPLDVEVLPLLQAPPTLNPFIDVPASPPNLAVIGADNPTGAPPVTFGTPPPVD